MGAKEGCLGEQNEGITEDEWERATPPGIDSQISQYKW
jgi:hypothetical protein